MSSTAALNSPMQRADVNVLTIAAMVTIGIAGAVMTIVMPGLLAALSISRHLSGSEAALLASSEMGGITAATVVISGWIARMDRRQAAFVTLLVLMAAHFASFLVPGFAALLCTRFLAGVCEGALLGIMSASISTTATPDRIFAIFLVGNLATSTAFLKLLGYLSASARPDWLFLVLVALSALPLVLLRWLPARLGSATPDAPMPDIKVDVRSGILALAGTLVLLVGVGMTWPLVGSLGLQHGFTAETIAGILSITTIVGMSAGILVYLLGQRAGRRIPIVVGTLGLGLSILGLMTSTSQLSFTLSACCFMFFWVGVTPFYSGVIAALDPTGRFSALFMAMQFAGLTVGPMIAAFILKIARPATPFLLGAACGVLAILLMVSAERGSRSA